MQDVSCAQLQSLHLGARQGLRAPTLQAFLAAFRAAEARRPLVVEVKRLQSDAARDRLIQLLRWVQLQGQHGVCSACTPARQTSMRALLVLGVPGMCECAGDTC
jgi:hypothetical protein